MNPRIAKLALAHLLWVATVIAFPSFAAPFIQGSAIATTPNQTLVLDLPPDGVLNCSSVSIECRSTLLFNPHALNTPVIIVSTGDVLVRGQIVVGGSPSSGTLGGAGGPGGFPGGMGGIAGGHTVGGNGAGPGGGKNTNGSFGGVFAYPLGGNTNVYGNALLSPIIGGSGGAGKSATTGGYGGGGGGGAIVIRSNTRIDIRADCGCCSTTGYIDARGGYGGSNPYSGAGGSGGAIRLIAPIVGGNGTLDTSGGLGGQACCTVYPDSGSQGRIRVDCLDDFSYRSLTFAGLFTRGTQMYITPPNPPRLDVVEAAGQSIPLGTTNAAYVSLEFNANTNQVVKLRAENFTNNVPVRIAVTPDTGPSLTFDGVITNTGSPTVTDFNVIIPAGTISRIDAWTR